jgi:hypothetical protein
MNAHEMPDVRAQKLHRDFIRHKLAAARVVHEFLPDDRARIERAKDIAHREMEETRDVAEDFALGSFAATRRAEQEVCAVLHWKSRASSVENGFGQGRMRTAPKAARKVVSGFSPQDHEKQDARFESARLCGLKPRNYFPTRAFGPALRFGLP